MGELDKYFIVKVQEIHYAYYEVYAQIVKDYGE